MLVSYSALKTKPTRLGRVGIRNLSRATHTPAPAYNNSSPAWGKCAYIKRIRGDVGSVKPPGTIFAVENGSYGTYDPRMPQRKVRIKIEHRIEYPDPLRVAAGERVNVGHEDAEFPGWKWCKASDGREGWVPVELLSNKGAEATVLQNYSAHELAVQPGEEVIVEESRHEWLLVRNALGECGWIPASSIEPL